VKQRNTDQLHDTLLAVSSPKSPSYGKLLNLEEVNALTSPSAESLKEVSTYMASFGATDVSYSSGFLRATVSIETAEKMLSTKYSTFKHSITGDVAVRCEEYSLPDHVAEHVNFVSPTVNFPQPFLRTQAVKSDSSENTQNTPDSLRELYGVGDSMGNNQASATQGVTAFLKQYYLESDLQTFYSTYFPELSGVPLSNVIGPNDDKAGIEASLDVEYMTVLGAGVPTEFWSFGGRLVTVEQLNSCAIIVC
jgi:tripeptidyl-peptidase I